MERQKKLNIIFVVVIVLLLGIIVYFLIEKGKNLKPDYAPGEIDERAVYTPDDDKKLKSSEGGGAVSMSYSNVVSVDLKKKKIKLFFKNPSKSNQEIVLQIVIEQNGKEYVIAKTDRIPAGYSVYEMKLLNTSLVKGGYKGKFSIAYYDEKTLEKAVLNTNIPITISVN